ncbi:hypothetical protein AB1E18_004674 [Capra hircus]
MRALTRAKKSLSGGTEAASAGMVRGETGVLNAEPDGAGESTDGPQGSAFHEPAHPAPLLPQSLEMDLQGQRLPRASAPSPAAAAESTDGPQGSAFHEPAHSAPLLPQSLETGLRAAPSTSQRTQPRCCRRVYRRASGQRLPRASAPSPAAAAESTDGPQGSAFHEPAHPAPLLPQSLEMDLQGQRLPRASAPSPAAAAESTDGPQGSAFHEPAHSAPLLPQSLETGLRAAPSTSQRTQPRCCRRVYRRASGQRLPRASAPSPAAAAESTDGPQGSAFHEPAHPAPLLPQSLEMDLQGQRLPRASAPSPAAAAESTDGPQGSAFHEPAHSAPLLPQSLETGLRAAPSTSQRTQPRCCRRVYRRASGQRLPRASAPSPAAAAESTDGPQGSAFHEPAHPAPLLPQSLQTGLRAAPSTSQRTQPCCCRRVYRRASGQRLPRVSALSPAAAAESTDGPQGSAFHEPAHSAPLLPQSLQTGLRAAPSTSQRTQPRCCRRV